MTPKIYTVILAGGSGTRLSGEKPKQFLPVGGKPLVMWSIDTFFSIGQIDSVIVTCHRQYLAEMKELLEGKEKINIIAGGESRQGSVYNALNHINGADNDIVLIHDAARPFVSRDVINACIKGVIVHNAVSVYVPAVDTLAEIENNNVLSIPDRDRFFYTQTPQGFRYSLIRDAHEKALMQNIANASDDVSLLIRAGYRIYKVDGNYDNIKVTTSVDLAVAQHLATVYYKE